MTLVEHNLAQLELTDDDMKRAKALFMQCPEVVAWYAGGRRATCHQFERAITEVVDNAQWHDEASYFVNELVPRLGVGQQRELVRQLMFSVEL